MNKPKISQRDLDQIWDADKIYLFISHREEHKVFGKHSYSRYKVSVNNVERAHERFDIFAKEEL